MYLFMYNPKMKPENIYFKFNRNNDLRCTDCKLFKNFKNYKSHKMLLNFTVALADNN